MLSSTSSLDEKLIVQAVSNSTRHERNILKLRKNIEKLSATKINDLPKIVDEMCKRIAKLDSLYSILIPDDENHRNITTYLIESLVILLKSKRDFSCELVIKLLSALSKQNLLHVPDGAFRVATRWFADLLQYMNFLLIDPTDSSEIQSERNAQRKSLFDLFIPQFLKQIQYHSQAAETISEDEEAKANRHFLVEEKNLYTARITPSTKLYPMISMLAHYAAPHTEIKDIDKLKNDLKNDKKDLSNLDIELQVYAGIHSITIHKMELRGSFLSRKNYLITSKGKLGTSHPEYHNPQIIHVIEKNSSVQPGEESVLTILIPNITYGPEKLVSDLLQAYFNNFANIQAYQSSQKESKYASQSIRKSLSPLGKGRDNDAGDDKSSLYMPEKQRVQFSLKRAKSELDFLANELETSYQIDIKKYYHAVDVHSLLDILVNASEDAENLIHINDILRILGINDPYANTHDYRAKKDRRSFFHGLVKDIWFAETHQPQSSGKSSASSTPTTSPQKSALGIGLECKRTQPDLNLSLVDKGAQIRQNRLAITDKSKGVLTKLIQKYFRDATTFSSHDSYFNSDWLQDINKNLGSSSSATFNFVKLTGDKTDFNYLPQGLEGLCRFLTEDNEQCQAYMQAEVLHAAVFTSLSILMKNDDSDKKVEKIIDLFLVPDFMQDPVKREKRQERIIALLKGVGNSGIPLNKNFLLANGIIDIPEFIVCLESYIKEHDLFVTTVKNTFKEDPIEDLIYMYELDSYFSHMTPQDEYIVAEFDETTIDKAKLFSQYNDLKKPLQQIEEAIFNLCKSASVKYVTAHYQNEKRALSIERTLVNHFGRKGIKSIFHAIAEYSRISVILTNNYDQLPWDVNSSIIPSDKPGIEFKVDSLENRISLFHKPLTKTVVFDFNEDKFTTQCQAFDLPIEKISNRLNEKNNKNLISLLKFLLNSIPTTIGKTANSPALLKLKSNYLTSLIVQSIQKIPDKQKTIKLIDQLSLNQHELAIVISNGINVDHYNYLKYFGNEKLCLNLKSTINLNSDESDAGKEKKASDIGLLKLDEINKILQEEAKLTKTMNRLITIKSFITLYLAELSKLDKRLGKDKKVETLSVSQLSNKSSTKISDSSDKGDSKSSITGSRSESFSFSSPGVLSVSSPTLISNTSDIVGNMLLTEFIRVVFARVKEIYSGDQDEWFDKESVIWLNLMVTLQNTVPPPQLYQLIQVMYDEINTEIYSSEFLRKLIIISRHIVNGKNLADEYQQLFDLMRSYKNNCSAMLDLRVKALTATTPTNIDEFVEKKFSPEKIEELLNHATSVSELSSDDKPHAIHEFVKEIKESEYHRLYTETQGNNGLGGETLLTYFIENCAFSFAGHPEIFKIILKAFPINAISLPNRRNQTPLFIALEYIENKQENSNLLFVPLALITSIQGNLGKLEIEKILSLVVNNNFENHHDELSQLLKNVFLLLDQYLIDSENSKEKKRSDNSGQSIINIFRENLANSDYREKFRTLLSNLKMDVQKIVPNERIKFCVNLFYLLIKIRQPVLLGQLLRSDGLELFNYILNDKTSVPTSRGSMTLLDYLVELIKEQWKVESFLDKNSLTWMNKNQLFFTTGFIDYCTESKSNIREFKSLVMQIILKFGRDANKEIVKDFIGIAGKMLDGVFVNNGFDRNWRGTFLTSILTLSRDTTTLGSIHKGIKLIEDLREKISDVCGEGIKQFNFNKHLKEIVFDLDNNTKNARNPEWLQVLKTLHDTLQQFAIRMIPIEGIVKDFSECKPSVFDFLPENLFGQRLEEKMQTVIRFWNLIEKRTLELFIKYPKDEQDKLKTLASEIESKLLPDRTRKIQKLEEYLEYFAKLKLLCYRILNQDPMHTQFIVLMGLIFGSKIESLTEPTYLGITNIVGKVGTGQGKSLIFGLFALYLRFRGYQMDCITFYEALVKRDHNNLKNLFDCFDHVKSLPIIDNLHESTSSPDELKKHDIIYTLNNNLMWRFHNHEFRGHPKPRRIILADEIDVLALDNDTPFVPGDHNISKITHFCYSIWEKLKSRKNEFNRYSKDIILNETIEEFAKICDNSGYSKYIKDRIKRDLKEWVCNAERILFSDTEKKANFDSVGVPQNLTEGSTGIFRALKEGRSVDKISSESESSYIHPILILKDQVIFGLSGCLGSAREQEHYTKHLNIKVFEAPTTYSYFLEKYKDKPKVIKLNPIIVPNAQWVERLAMRAIELSEEGRPVLVVLDCEPKSDELQLLHDTTLRILNSAGKFNRVMKLTGDKDVDGSDDFKSLIEAATAMHPVPGSTTRKVGTISFGTKLIGRGTDFRVKDKSVNTKGGFCVIEAFIAPTSRMQVQIEGRTYRWELCGTIQFFLKFDEVIAFLKKDVVGLPKEHDDFVKLLDDVRDKTTASRFSAEQYKLYETLHEIRKHFYQEFKKSDVRIKGALLDDWCLVLNMLRGMKDSEGIINSFNLFIDVYKLQRYSPASIQIQASNSPDHPADEKGFAAGANTSTKTNSPAKKTGR